MLNWIKTGPLEVAVTKEGIYYIAYNIYKENYELRVAHYRCSDTELGIYEDARDAHAAALRHQIRKYKNNKKIIVFTTDTINIFPQSSSCGHRYHAWEITKINRIKRDLQLGQEVAVLAVSPEFTEVESNPCYSSGLLKCDSGEVLYIGNINTVLASINIKEGED